MIHWQLPVVLSKEQGEETNTPGTAMEKCISHRRRECSENKHQYMPTIVGSQTTLFF